MRAPLRGAYHGSVLSTRSSPATVSEPARACPKAAHRDLPLGASETAVIGADPNGHKRTGTQKGRLEMATSPTAHTEQRAEDFRNYDEAPRRVKEFYEL